MPRGECFCDTLQGTLFTEQLIFQGHYRERREEGLGKRLRQVP